MDNNRIDFIRKALAPAFAGHGIFFAYLFGSAATTEETPLSDIDLAVYVSSPDSFSFNDNYAPRRLLPGPATQRC